jgi:hypothetical protein
MFLFTDKIGNLEPEKSFTVACPFRVNFCRAISRNARPLYPAKLPRRPFAVEAFSSVYTAKKPRPSLPSVSL